MVLWHRVSSRRLLRWDSLPNRTLAWPQYSARSQSTVAPTHVYRGSWGSHVLAGVIGGVVVLGSGRCPSYLLIDRRKRSYSGYARYHISGAKRAVDSALKVKTYLDENSMSLKALIKSKIEGSEGGVWVSQSLDAAFVDSDRL